MSRRRRGKRGGDLRFPVGTRLGLVRQKGGDWIAAVQVRPGGEVIEIGGRDPRHVLRLLSREVRREARRLAGR